MTPNIQEIPNAAVCLAKDADGAREEFAPESAVSTRLIQRQLSAAGLEDIAQKVAVGRRLELHDAVLLSRASLPLLGRIVQLSPLSVGWTSESVAENGTDSEVHPTSAELPVARVVSAEQLPRLIAQHLTDWETYCRQLIALRDELGASSEPAAWYPKVNRSPDENASSVDDYTGVEILRAIALARLMLPESVQIVAPLTTLGPKLAQVALDFGATHLGYVSCGGEPLENPLAVNMDELKGLQGSCPPTAMTEDS